MLLLSLSLLAVFAHLVDGQPLGGGGYRRYGGNFNPYNCIPYPAYGGSYGNVGGGGYPGGGYGGGGYGGGAKPSYVYTAPYQPSSSNYGYGYGQGYRPGQNYGGGQGYTGGLSGYEGPSGGYNTYTQPGISYPPPNYYGAGYGSGSSTYNNANLPPMGYGNGNDITGQTSALDCIDRSGDCAVQAATGQCASNPTVQALCPRSCGICRSIVNPITSTAGGGIGNALGGSFPPFGVGGVGIPSLPLTVLSSNAPPFTSIPESTFLTPQLGQFPQLGFPQQFSQCADAHVDGCPTWAALGYCQQAPEFMSSYCRASCGLCHPVPMTGIFPDVLPFAGDPNAPFAANFDDLSQLASGTGMQSPFPFTPYPYRSSIFSASGFEKRQLNKALFDSENADRPPSSLSTIVRMDQLAGSA